VHAVKIQQGVERVSILGYCLGALLSVIYAALDPADVKALITLALPLEMRSRGLAERIFGWLDEDTIANLTSAYGNCPAWLLKNLFATMTVIHWVGQWFGLYPENEAERYAMMFPALRRWLQSDVPIAGRLFHELAVDVFKKNLLARGAMMLTGELVDLKRIGAPLLKVVADSDIFVPPSRALHNLNSPEATTRRT
jgi:polyhydroxyalkanoate synthase